MHAAFDQLIQRLFGLIRREAVRTQDLPDRALVAGGHASPPERIKIHSDGDPVQLDGAFKRIDANRHMPSLDGIAQKHQVARDAVAKQRGGEARRVDEIGRLLAAGFGDQLHHAAGPEGQVRVQHELGHWRAMGVDDCCTDLRAEAPADFRVGRDDHVAAEEQVGTAASNRDGVDLLRFRRQADLGDHRSALLGEPDLVQDADTFSFDVCSHPQHRPHRHDTGPADAGNDHVARTVEVRLRGIRQARHQIAENGAIVGRRRLAHLRPGNRHETRAEALHAREILVAGGLVDLALAPKLRLQGLD